MASVCSGVSLNFFRYSRLVRLEGLAVLVLHQRHAEHVDAVALARALGIEHEGAGNVVVVLRFAGHGHSPELADNNGLISV